MQLELQYSKMVVQFGRIYNFMRENFRSSSPLAHNRTRPLLESLSPVLTTLDYFAACAGRSIWMYRSPNHKLCRHIKLTLVNRDYMHPLIL